MPAQVQFFIYKSLQVLLTGCSQPLYPTAYIHSGGCLTCVQGLALVLVEPQAHMCPLLVLLRSLWMALHPSGESATPLSLVPANLLRVLSIPLSVSLMNTLNINGPSKTPKDATHPFCSPENSAIDHQYPDVIRYIFGLSMFFPQSPFIFL